MTNEEEEKWREYLDEEPPAKIPGIDAPSESEEWPEGHRWRKYFTRYRGLAQEYKRVVDANREIPPDEAKRILAEDMEFAVGLNEEPSFEEYEDYQRQHTDAKRLIALVRAFYKKFGLLKFDELVKDGHLKVCRDVDSHEIVPLTTMKRIDVDGCRVVQYG